MLSRDLCEVMKLKRGKTKQISTESREERLEIVNLVIYDSDINYGHRFFSRAMELKKSHVKIQLFREIRKLEKYLSDRETDFLVIDQPSRGDLSTNSKIKKIYLLTDREIGGWEGEEKQFNKYQKADDILARIFDDIELIRGEEYLINLEKDKRNPQFKLNSETNLEKNGQNASLAEPVLGLAGGVDTNSTNLIKGRKKVLEKKEDEGDCTQLIGVYSPIHRIGKTNFAIELGKEIAKEKRALYLNLEPYAGSHNFPQTLDENLGNLLYYAGQDYENLGLKISTMTGQMDKLDYITPISIQQDLHVIKTEHWLDLISKILHHCIYETIILDVSDGIQGLYEILDSCDLIYTHFIEESPALGKMKMYTENLIQTGYESILEKTIQKKVTIQ